MGSRMLSLVKDMEICLGNLWRAHSSLQVVDIFNTILDCDWEGLVSSRVVKYK